MTLGKWMILIGGILLATGLISALRSNRDESRAMGEKARMGIIAFAPEVDSAEYKERRSIYHTL
jgi:hypothetical protein